MPEDWDLPAGPWCPAEGEIARDLVASPWGAARAHTAARGRQRPGGGLRLGATHPGPPRRWPRGRLSPRFFEADTSGRTGGPGQNASYRLCGAGGWGLAPARSPYGAEIAVICSPPPREHLPSTGIPLHGGFTPLGLSPNPISKICKTPPAPAGISNPLTNIRSQKGKEDRHGRP